MKRIMGILVIVILLFAITANGEGLLPGITESFDIAMPSLSRVLIRNHDTEDIAEDGSIILTYNEVEEEQFNRFSDYIEEYGCTLVDYTVEEQEFHATVEYMGKTFKFIYNAQERTAKAIYPHGVVPESLNPILTAKIGDIVTFGTYEQDNDETNGKEPIEWIILNKTEEKCLLMSKYGLDAIPYTTDHYDYKNIKKQGAWEDSSLRKWLNSDFIDIAFDQYEKNAIRSTPVPKGENPQYYNDEFVETITGTVFDHVFIPSISEVEEYLPSSESRKLNCTPYAATKRMYTSGISSDLASYWWLRTAYRPPNDLGALIVMPDGTYFGRNLLGGQARAWTKFDAKWVVIRPMMTLTLEKL